MKSILIQLKEVEREKRERDGMEEMLSGRDTGAIGCANKHCLSCLAMA